MTFFQHIAVKKQFKNPAIILNDINACIQVLKYALCYEAMHSSARYRYRNNWNKKINTEMFLVSKNTVEFSLKRTQNRCKISTALLICRFSNVLQVGKIVTVNATFFMSGCSG